jgi:hypothetical protein
MHRLIDLMGTPFSTPPPSLTGLYFKISFRFPIEGYVTYPHNG